MDIAVVTGATGCIGRALVRKLLQDGFRVRTLVRDPTLCSNLFGSSVEMIAGDLSDRAAVAQAIRGADAVFHAAAYVHKRPKSAAEVKRLFEVNVECTRELLRGCDQTSLKSFVFFSTIAVYGRNAGVLSKQTPCLPDTPYGESKLRAEQIVTSYFDKTGVKPVVLRPSMVFGEGDRGNFVRMVRAIDKGRFVLLSPAARKSVAYSCNVAEIAARSARTPAAYGETLVVADETNVTVSDLARMIAECLGRRNQRFITLPIAPIRRLGQLLSAMHSRLGVPVPFTGADVDALTGDTVCDIARLRSVLAYPSVPLREAIDSTIRWYCSKARC